ncbi:MAG: SAM-dependent DNA methyltransferase [Pirellulales bacterium]|nr:SAM-dependent DNA methyltransferase [Pirellulales bacterium]
MPEPILVIGNPPWVTNAALSSLGSVNLPVKSNFHGYRGFDAKTGKSNFDISEWMLLHLLELLNGRRATLAMLCKTMVARKVLQHAWKHGFDIGRAEIHRIDATAHFNAAVDACLFCCYVEPGKRTVSCQTYEALDDSSKRHTFGYDDGRLVADIEAYSQWRHLLGESPYRWRSGVKHDCSKVMELSEAESGLRNGFGETVNLEPEYLFPMLKSSELANGRTGAPRRWMIVTQQEIGQETKQIEAAAPKTWHYLTAHADYLDKRGSSIYRKRPRFSVFGVGDYTFAPWKIAVSGFYKSLRFARLGPFQERPVVLDDTGYLLPCTSQQEAEFLYELLVSEPARQFYSSLIFWDAKRPITTDLLCALNLDKLAAESGLNKPFNEFCRSNPWTTKSAGPRLFD